MDITLKLSEEFKLKPEYSANIISLIGEGNTIPFIARYRKEMHGECDDQVLRDFAERLSYLQNLVKRKEEVTASITEQGKWTDELALALAAAQTLTEVEDIYRPYKPKKKTRASVAIEKGLQPLADIIWAQEMQEVNLDELAAPYIDAEKGLETTKDCIDGARDIIAEIMSDDAANRKNLRRILNAEGSIASCFSFKEDDEEAKKKLKDKIHTYEMYKEYEERIGSIPSHRILAINRGENEECLKASIKVDDERCIAAMTQAFKKSSGFDAIIDEAIKDSYARLIFPSIEREVRSDLTDIANEQAIKMFESNLKPLLMQPPLKGKVVLGLDPGYRTGCKMAVVDSSGNVLDHGVIYVTMSEERSKDAALKVVGLINKHKVNVISIGNGTASKETEIFVAGLIKENNLPISYAVVNEAGASVYSASKVGAEEFPDYDVTIRGAISIARRLIDPLAELIKIDVKSIGVGQYQHDMPQKRLTEALEGVVEDCVNSVGVDLNTASPSLLGRVAGLNSTIAKNIAEYRKAKPFETREELRKVPKLGPKAYEQCAGFLRILGGSNPLDNTGVHPEAYVAINKVLEKYGVKTVEPSVIGEVKNKITADGTEVVALEVGIGAVTLIDCVEEMLRPGRDIRDSLPPPVLRADLMEIKDLEAGMILDGVVRNVIDFGAFVDIGVHHDGLLHLSQISDDYIKHPSEKLKVGQAVKVRVLEVDVAKNRIGLTMKSEHAVPQVKKEDGGAKRVVNRNFLDDQKKVDRPKSDRPKADRPQGDRPVRMTREQERELIILAEKEYEELEKSGAIEDVRPLSQEQAVRREGGFKPREDRGDRPNFAPRGDRPPRNNFSGSYIDKQPVQKQETSSKPQSIDEMMAALKGKYGMDKK